MRLRGHFNGTQVELDEPAPPGLRPNAPVEVVVFEAREQALRDLETFLKALWSRPLPADVPPLAQRRWRREDLYERGR